MTDQILVTGLPRSGTSLVAGALAICGAWVGTTPPGNPLNRRGTHENIALRETLTKPLLQLLGADPLGLDPLPPLAPPPLVTAERWRQLVDDRLVADRFDPGRGAPWLYKDAKLCLIRRQWADAFPAARWVVVRRRRDEIIASCLRAEPMTRRMGVSIETWRGWADAYQAHLDCVADAVVVWPHQALLADPARFEPVVRELGLTWRPREVAEFVDPMQWHGRVGEL
ncbi:MAG: hypothetical protein VW338_16100 [Rhodospirillaceae bacterium]